MSHKIDRNELKNRMLSGLAKVGGRQATGALYRDNPTNEKKPGSACALGALALGYDIPITEIRGGATWWPTGLANPRVSKEESPYEKIVNNTLGDCIMNLNDSYHWKIEDIAAWVADPTYRPADYVKPLF